MSLFVGSLDLSYVDYSDKSLFDTLVDNLKSDGRYKESPLYRGIDFVNNSYLFGRAFDKGRRFLWAFSE